MMKSKDAPTTSSPKRSDSKLIFLLAGLLILLNTWVQATPLLRSGTFDRQGNLNFYNFVLFRDSTIHLGMIGELLHSFPPANFTYTAEGVMPLKNYHYLYDSALTAVVKLTHFSVLDIYFRFSPIVISILLSLLIYKTTYELTKNRFASVLTIFFTIWGTTLGVITPAIKSLIHAFAVNHGSNIYMTDQLIDIMVNPHGALSLVVFLALFLLINKYERTGKNGPLVIFSFLLATSFGIKAYGGIVFAVGSLFASAWQLLKNKDWKLTAATTVGLGGMFFWILNTVDSKVPGLVLAPFWTLDRMMGDSDKLNVPAFVTSRQAAIDSGNILKVTILTAISGAIYFIGNLGLRLVGLLAIGVWLKRIAGLKSSEVFLLTCAFISFLVPLIFNQGIKAYDIVQFSTYFTLFMGVMFGISFWEIVKKIKKTSLKTLFVFAMAIVFLLNNIYTIKDRLILPKYEVTAFDPQLLEAMSYVRSNTSPTATFLLTPTDYNLESHWFNSLAQRRTIYSGWRFAQQLGVDRDKAEEKLFKLFDQGDSNIKYDYLLIFPREQLRFGTIIQREGLQTVFENERVKIFKNPKYD